MYYESSKHQSALDNCIYNISLDYRAGCKISADREYLFRTERVYDPVITMTFMTPLGWILALGASKSRKWISEGQA